MTTSSLGVEGLLSAALTVFRTRLGQNWEISEDPVGLPPERCSEVCLNLSWYSPVKDPARLRGKGLGVVKICLK